MSERATAKNIHLQAPSPALSGNDSTVRPKVLKRPAHFGAQAPVAAAVATLIPVLPSHTEEKAVPSSRTWQDDGRFAITLLAIVIVVNLIVSAWLSAIEPHQHGTQTLPIATGETPRVTSPALNERKLQAPETSSPIMSEQ